MSEPEYLLSVAQVNMRISKHVLAACKQEQPRSLLEPTDVLRNSSLDEYRKDDSMRDQSVMSIPPHG